MEKHTTDKYKELAEKLEDVSRRLYSNCHYGDADIASEAADVFHKIYEEIRKEQIYDYYLD